MQFDKNFLKVISALGEVIELRELSITCQKYEIDKLKATIEELENKEGE